MKLWSVLSRAAIGWMMLLRGEEGWREQFRLSAAGFATALAIFGCVIFLIVMTIAIGTDLPGIVAIIASMLALALPLVAILAALYGTHRSMRGTESLLPVLVPGTYALTAFILVEGVLAIVFAGPLVMLSWLALGYLLYRLARAATGWPTSLALGFAVLSILLLVVMRQALYMLSSIAGPPT